MSSTPTPAENRKRANCANHTKYDYQFYDENFRPIWNRGISRKIGESPFVQQKLATIRPTWSGLKVCPFLLLMGALFVGMGVGIKKFSDNIQEVIIPYTDCVGFEKSGKTCYEIISFNISKQGKHGTFYQDANDIENCTCYVQFELKEPMNGSIYMYYALTNFYQNHKDYYLSRDENQLRGNLFNKYDEPKKPSSACEPFDYHEGRIVYPCGLMANSMFTDVINLFYHDNESVLRKRNVKQDEIVNPIKYTIPVPLKNTGIAWESDREDKYKNHAYFENAKHPKWQNFIKPRRWKRSLWELDPANFSNNGVQNEDFINWMRTAAFPWFRKLYRIVDSNQSPFENGLPSGNYTLEIQYNYDVTWEKVEGDKKIILTTTTMVAGKNMFLAIVYMSTGSLCMLVSIVLFIVHQCTRKSFQKSLKED